MASIGKTKDYSTKEFQKLLNDNGFTLVRTKGDHYIYKRGKDTVVATKEPNKMMVRRMIKTHNLRFR